MQISSNASLPSALPFRVAVGAVVDGKFRVERILAEGGMGIVVAATHLQLDQPVALKFLRDEVSSDKEALARFTREARAAARLKSEHVARVLDVSVTSDGTPYMVMEYLEGLNLYSVLEALGPLDISSAAEYAIQTCEGLAEAHARGIVHRDIKPDNLFLVDRSGWEAIKILDFGISKIGVVDANLTTGVIMGSPCYMSPEQLRSSSEVDHRTDIWSLGATLHELLTGHAAFDPLLTLPELVEAIQHKPVRPVRELRPQVPELLSAIVGRCLSKDREARFESAAQLANALLPFAPARASGPAVRAASMAPAFPISRPGSRLAEPVAAEKSSPSETPPPLSVSTPPVATLTSVARPRSKYARLAIAAAGTCVTLVVALYVLRRESPPRVQTFVARAPIELPVSTAAAPVGPSETSDPAVRNPPVSNAHTAQPVEPNRSAAPARPPRRASAPAPAPSATVVNVPAASSAQVNPAGGRPPLRPIDTKNPFGNP